jgi:hypothetical protein
MRWPRHFLLPGVNDNKIDRGIETDWGYFEEVSTILGYLTFRRRWATATDDSAIPAGSLNSPGPRGLLHFDCWISMYDYSGV